MPRVLALLAVRACLSHAIKPPRAVLKFAVKSSDSHVPVKFERTAFEFLRRLYRQPVYPEPVKPSGRGSYEFSRDEGAALLRITRLMRQAALLLTLTGALTIVHSVHSAVTNSWQDFFEIFSVIDDVTISYYLLISASAFVAIADSHKRDTDFLLASLEALGRLWDAARIPLAMQLSYYVNACLGPWIYPPARAAVASGVETSKGLVAAVAGVLGSSQ